MLLGLSINYFLLDDSGDIITFEIQSVVQKSKNWFVFKTFLYPKINQIAQKVFKNSRFGVFLNLKNVFGR